MGRRDCTVSKRKLYITQFLREGKFLEVEEEPWRWRQGNFAGQYTIDGQTVFANNIYFDRDKAVGDAKVFIKTRIAVLEEQIETLRKLEKELK